MFSCRFVSVIENVKRIVAVLIAASKDAHFIDHLEDSIIQSARLLKQYRSLASFHPAQDKQGLSIPQVARKELLYETHGMVSRFSLGLFYYHVSAASAGCTGFRW